MAEKIYTCNRCGLPRAADEMRRTSRLTVGTICKECNRKASSEGQIAMHRERARRVAETKRKGPVKPRAWIDPLGRKWFVDSCYGDESDHWSVWMIPERGPVVQCLEITDGSFETRDLVQLALNAFAKTQIGWRVFRGRIAE